MSGSHLVVGKVRRAHGIRGELVIETTTDAPDAIFASGRRVFAGDRGGILSPSGETLSVLRASPFKGGLIVAFAEITDRTTAERWRDRSLLLPEDEVPEHPDDRIAVHELIGMQVVRLNGEAVGEVRQVFELPQGWMMEVARSGGREVLIPFDDNTVTGVDDAARVIHIDPVDGLID